MVEVAALDGGALHSAISEGRIPITVPGKDRFKNCAVGKFGAINVAVEADRLEHTIGVV